MAGISSFFTALIGLPQLSDSSAGELVGLRLDCRRDFEEVVRALGRSVRDQLENAEPAADTARSICACEASGSSRIELPVLGLRIVSSVSTPASIEPPMSIFVSMDGFSLFMSFALPATRSPSRVR